MMKKIALFLLPVVIAGAMLFTGRATAWKYQQNVWNTTTNVSQTITGMTEEAFVDSLLKRFPTMGLPTIPDTTRSALDSLTVYLLADVVNLPVEYATHLTAIGNGTAPADSLFLVRAFVPPKADPDSIYWWIKASAVTADSASYGVTITQKTGTVDVPFTGVYLGVTAANTWERKAYAFDAFKAGVYDLVIRFRLRVGHKLWISPIYFK